MSRAQPHLAACRRQRLPGRVTRTSLAYFQHQVGDAAAAATALHSTCTEVGISVGCLSPPRNARGHERDYRRDESTVDVSLGLPCGDSDPYARGYSCARETLCAARRGEGARPREALCAGRGHRSRATRGLDEVWLNPILWDTCGVRVSFGSRRPLFPVKSSLPKFFL